MREDDDLDLFDDDDESDGHDCQCERTPLLELFQDDPLLRALATALIIFGPESQPPMLGPWHEFKKAYEPICKLLLANRAETTDENAVRYASVALASATVSGGEAINASELASWLSRIRNTIVDFRDEP